MSSPASRRWRDGVTRSRGMVPPAVFIPVAEDSGLILPLGEWALTGGLPQRGAMARSISRSPSTSRRCSSRHPTCSRRARSDTRGNRAGAAPARARDHRADLHGGQREDAVDPAPAQAARRPHRHGRFRHRLLVAQLSAAASRSTRSRWTAPSSPTSTEGTEHVVIVQAVVSIARALGMTTTAEGVETVGQQEFLAALGCDEAQGYLFSPAVPIEKVPDIIAEWTANEDRWRREPDRRQPSRRSHPMPDPRLCGAARPPVGRRCASCQSRNSPGRDHDAPIRSSARSSARRPRRRSRSPSPRPASGSRTATPQSRRQQQRAGPEILPGRIGDAAEDHHARRRRPSATGSRTAAGSEWQIAIVTICHISSVLADFGLRHAAHRDGDAAVHHRIGEREQRADREQVRARDW